MAKVILNIYHLVV